MVDQLLGVELERKIVWVEAQIWVAWGEICASQAPFTINLIHVRVEPLCLAKHQNRQAFPENRLLVASVRRYP